MAPKTTSSIVEGNLDGYLGVELNKRSVVSPVPNQTFPNKEGGQSCDNNETTSGSGTKSLPPQHGASMFNENDKHHSETKNEDILRKPGSCTTNPTSFFLPWIGAVVWPLMLFVPLLLAYSPFSYDVLFPREWYEFNGVAERRPKPLGLCLGILAVGVGQIFVLIYFYLHSHGYLLSTSSTINRTGKSHSPMSIQSKGAPQYDFAEGLQVHLSQPEGFGLLVTYLSATWMFHWMPDEYYSFEGGIQWGRLALCLMLQDCIQYMMHLCEHNVSAKFYQWSHKPHHKFTNPKLFDAFNGSLLDTIVMILIPLYSTALLVHCNVWTYMAFGSMYANWLTLIHSEFPLPWDKAFRRIGLGTAGDHHIHHKLFKFNFGHLFMWWDRLVGTYRSPMDYPTIFSPQA